MFITVKKILLVVILGLCGTVFAFSQTNSQARPRLGILPFTGGAEGDGETIATLFSFQPEILEAFIVVPRTSAVNAILAEHYFQMTGYTDSDTIAGIGRMIGADYVISGNIRRLGNRNLVIATIVNVETFEQVAGYFRTYRDIREIRGFLPSMSGSMVAAALGRDTSRLPSLVIAPFSGIDAHEAETLSQVLAVEILNTGSYVVLPRTSAMQAALEEHDFQMRGYTADEEAVSLGRAINADLVLSAGVHRLGDINIFTAQILHVEDGRLIAGVTRDYRVIEDGVNLMAEIAILLTDPRGAEARIAALHRQRRQVALFGDSARFWSVGFSVGTSFAEPWLVGTVQATLAPFRHSFARIGGDVGFISGMGGVGYFSVTPFVHYAFFLPFDALPMPFERGGWYIGAGGGFIVAEYRFDGFSIPRRTLAADFTTGLNIANMIDISYTLRTDFSSAVHRVSVGVIHRFQPRSR